MNDAVSSKPEARSVEENGAGSSTYGSVAAQSPAIQTANNIQAASQSNTPSRANPCTVPLIEKRSLTGEVSGKLTIHLVFSTAGTPVAYEPGDACGIFAANDPRLVEELLAALGFDGSEPVTIERIGTTTLHEALLNHLSISKISRRMIHNYATRGQCEPLLGMLVPEQSVRLEQYIYGREVIDLLLEYPGVLETPAEFAAMLPKLTPRLYSIASSPSAHAGEVHLTVAVVRYRTYDRQRGGVVSTLLSDRVEVGQSLPIYIQVNKKFKLPQDSDAPIIMIGPGTGIAPFRSFLFERLHTGAKGRNWLFFGERSAATDFLYQEDWEKMTASGHLTQFHTAFSRDQEKKIYVQDRMIENAPDFWRWLQDGASLYVCGNAEHMAKDVDRALLTIVAQQGQMGPEAAQEYLQGLRNEHRYHRDVY